jgi:peptidyl-dipeptidase A
VRATYITEDTQWLEAKAGAEIAEAATQYAREASKFDGVKVDPDTRRKLELLKRGISFPTPSTPGAAEEMATIGSRLDSMYSTGKFNHKGKTLTLGDAEDVLASSRDPAETKAIYEGWRTIAPPMRTDYARLVDLANTGARELGYKDTGAIWRY